MIYINDPKQPHYTYDNVVNAAIDSGIDPKRAYIYLAGLGVKGLAGRVMSESGLSYARPVKLAVKDDKLVIKVNACKSCKGLIIE